jgi:hypothetical protein|eukprot:SAG25_NODE_19_length_23408_cov_10.997040_24_plen_83_part_00
MIFVDDSDEESPPDGDDGGGGADDAMDMAADDVEGAEPMVGMEAAAATEPDTAVFTFSAHEGDHRSFAWGLSVGYGYSCAHG